MKIDSLGGRRWVGFLLLSGLATWMLASGHLDRPGAQQWVGLVVWLYGIFAGVNVIQRGVEAIRDVKTAEELPK